MDKIFLINLVFTTTIHATAYGVTNYVDVYSKAADLEEAKRKAINHVKQQYNLEVARAGGYPAFVQDENRYVHLIK